MIPHYVQKLPDADRGKWQQVYDHFSPRGEAVGLLAANSWLQNRIEETRNSPVVREVIQFHVDTSKEFIKCTDSGEEYVDALLQDVYGDVDGRKWTPQMLEHFAKQVNEDNPIVGDINHDEYDRIMRSAMSDEEVERMFREKKGIAKSVKAIYKDGQFWLRALIDKRYKKMLLEKAKGLSIEAVVTKNDRGEEIGGKILGWTFVIGDEHQAANPRAAIVA